jgi:hypothetical protein
LSIAPGRIISKNYKFEKKWRKRKVKEYSKGIYVKFKPEEVEILHNRMKEAGVQNMSAYIRKMALNGYVIIPEWPDLNQVISFNDLKCREKDQQGRCSDYN